MADFQRDTVPSQLSWATQHRHGRFRLPAPQLCPARPGEEDYFRRISPLLP